MGIYTERKTGKWFVAAVLTAAFAALYGVWLFVGPELMRSEVVYAAAAAESSLKRPLVMTVHGWATPECLPLLPVTARLLRDLTGLPMESVLRGVSILMLAAGAGLVYLAAVPRQSARAGVVAAAMYFSCFLALGTAVEGTPATTNAFFLAAAQMVFFQYGVRRSDWNRAWIFSALLVTAGFFSGGATVPIFFVFPMFFFRRPMSVSSKFRRPGFVAAVVIAALAVLAWGASFGASPRQVSLYDMWQFGEVSLRWRMLTFPFLLVFWLLPWSLIAWMPFCEALRSTDRTPIYSRYLRTLVIPSLGLLWLLPETGRFGLFYILAPLSVLTGRFYELGIRRYGVRLRKFFPVLELFMAAAPLAIAAGCFLPEAWLGKLFSMRHTLQFREAANFRSVALAVMVLALLLALYVHKRRGGDPAWMILLAVSVASALFFNTLVFPYKSQDQHSRAVGRRLREVLPEGRIVYTKNVPRSMNGALFYSGLPMYRMDHEEGFPSAEQEDVHLLLLNDEFPGKFPQFSGFGGWKNVETFDCDGRSMTLWKGRWSRPKTDDAAPTEGEATKQDGSNESNTGGNK